MQVRNAALQVRSLSWTLLAVLACDLDERVVPAADPRPVVHAVLRADLPQQFVLVEQTLAGAVPPDVEVSPVPPGELQLPIADARVRVAHLTGDGGSCGDTVAFDARPLAGPDVPGVYWSPPGCPLMRPGDRLGLIVDAGPLGVVTGTTRIPRLQDVAVSVGGRPALQPGDTLRFNRDRDSVRVAVDGDAYGGIQLVAYDVGDAPWLVAPAEPVRPGTLSLMLLVQSPEVLLPGTIRHVLRRGTGEHAFRGGARYRMVVAVADSNYYDFVRTTNNTITGRGFANRLQGGLGVFGSLVGPTYVLEAESDVDDPREGTIRLRGSVDTVNVDATLTVYLDPVPETGWIRGFLTGRWLQVTIAPGAFWVGRAVSQSVGGTFDGDSLKVTVPTVELYRGRESLFTVALRARPGAASTFAVRLVRVSVVGETAIAELTGERQ